MIRKGPALMLLVFSPDCPHCITYKPIWDKLARTKGKRMNMVSMQSDVYNQTPLSEKAPVNAVPSVLYVDKNGQVSEGTDIRNMDTMTKVVKTGSPDTNITSNAAPNFKPILPGTSLSENPLKPFPAMQTGGNPWAAFMMAARQAAPAAALLGAYSALPKRSSGLPKARTRKLRRQL